MRLVWKDDQTPHNDAESGAEKCTPSNAELSEIHVKEVSTESGQHAEGMCGKWMWISTHIWTYLRMLFTKYMGHVPLPILVNLRAVCFFQLIFVTVTTYVKEDTPASWCLTASQLVLMLSCGVFYFYQCYSP